MVEADNGLGVSRLPTPTTENLQPTGVKKTITVESKRYKIVPGGDPLVIECTPSAKAIGVGGGASVTYDVSVSVPYIALTGTIDDTGTKRILTGQNVGANLMAGYPVVQPGTSPLTNGIPNWSFQLGASICFGGFVIGAGQITGKANNVKLDVAALNFYTKAQGAFTVKCTATIKFPDNTTGDISVVARKVYSDKPTVVWNIRSGTVGFTAGNANFGLIGKSGGPSRGQQWAATVAMPGAFSTVAGNCAFLQLSNANNDYITSFAPPNNDLTWPAPADKGEGLDNMFPYQAYIFAPGVQSNAGDSPNTTVTSDMLMVTMGGTYYTWLMYRPPGGEWVTIQKYKWVWAGTATYSGGSWSKSGVMVPPDQSGQDTDAHPSWTKKRVNGSPVPRNP